MTQKASGGKQSSSVLIVSQRDTFTQSITEMFPSEEQYELTNKNTSFAAMNGQAVELAFDYDVVIFDANPDAKEETEAVRQLLANRANKTIFLALTHNDVSIAKARELRDIGVDEVLPLSITGDSLKAVIDEKLGALKTPAGQATASSETHGQVIAVTQARGGIGATTVAVNLACSLVGKSGIFSKAEKRRVALLDLDIQFGNVNVFLDLEDNNGFLQTIESVDEPDARFMRSVLQSHPLGVDVLCAPVPVAPLQSVRPELIEAVLDILQQEYDFIVVDLPRALVDWVEPVLKRASQLAIVTDTTVPSVRQARRLIEFYREDNVALPIEVIVNREKRPMFGSEHIREAEKVLDTKLVHWLPDNPKIARRAVDLGQPVVDLKAGSDSGKAMTKVAAALVSHSQSEIVTKV